MINIKIFNVTALMTNCIYLTDEETGKTAVVDPGDKSDDLNKQIDRDGGKLEYVILTHGHYDHIGYAKQLADQYGAKIVTGFNNNEFLSKPEYNLSFYHDIDIKPFAADILLNDGDSFSLGNTKIKYITTPGHTIGCGSYIFDDTIITGDTLFCESYGRTDLPTGNSDEMVKSIIKLKNISGNYRIIPGHGELSTLDHERKYNPIMRSL